MKKVLFLLTLLGILGCKSDPYPEDIEVSGAPQVVAEVPSDVVIDFDEASFNYTEGVEGKKYFRVTYRGKPYDNVTFMNMPQGMKFDSATNELIWTPGFDAVSSDTKVKKTKVRVLVPDPGNNNAMLDRSFTVLVFDNAQDVEIKEISTNKTAIEGRSFSYKFELLSDDYPNGPFSVVSRDLMPGATIDVDNNIVTIKYKPNFFSCNVQKSSCKYNSATKEFTRSFYPTFEIFTNNNKTNLTQAIEFKVKDVRQKPSFKFLSLYKTNGNALNFDITALDKNGEISPKVKIIDESVFLNSGDYQLKNVFSHDVEGEIVAQTSTSRFIWKDIPSSLFGEVKNVEFEICTLTRSYVYGNCERKKVVIEVTGKDFKLPTISRTYWPLGEIKRTKVNEKFNVRMNISQGFSSNVDVKISPKEFEKYVTHRSGRLYVENAPEGVHQFNVVANGKWGAVTQESFLLEVLPANWSKNLVLGIMPSLKVTSGFMNLLPDANFTNPFIIPLDSRVLSFRDWVFLTEDSYSDQASEQIYNRDFDPVKNIFISANDFTKIPKKLAEEIKDLGVGLDSRLKDISNSSSIEKYQFVLPSDSTLTAIDTSEKLNLAGKLTTESSNPSILVSKSNSKCKILLAMNDGVSFRDLPLIYSCPRKNKGKLIISGFEWADIEGSGTNSSLAKKWLKKIVESL